MIQQTSLEAYMQAAPKISRCHKTILELLAYGQPMTNAEIAQRLNWSINRVTPRVLELRRLGLLCAFNVGLCWITGHKAIYWKIENTYENNTI